MNDTLISLSHLTVYDSERQHKLLSEVELNIKKNQFYTVVGHNGSGKSTLLHVVQQLADRYSYEGNRTSHISFVPYLPQQLQHYFIGETVWEELVLQYEAIYADDAMEVNSSYVSFETLETELSRIAEELHIGHLLYSPISQLSGGQQQLVALAAALLCRAEVILIDEMTAMLDVANRAAMLLKIRSIQKERALSIIYVTHDEAEIESTDHIIHVEAGTVTLLSYPQWEAHIEQVKLNESLMGQNGYQTEESLRKLAIEIIGRKHYTVAPISISNSEVEYTSRFKDKSFAFQSGVLNIIKGENGTGKSTLVKLIAGEILPIAGDIFIGEQLLSDTRDQVGYCPQFIDHYWAKETVYEECLFMLKAHHLRVVFGSEDEVNSYIRNHLAYFGFIEHDYTKRIYTLSIGQQRKLALALCFMIDKRWIVLDEPYAYLDSTMWRRLTLLIEEAVKAGRGVILISHESKPRYSVPIETTVLHTTKSQSRTIDMKQETINKQNEAMKCLLNPLQLLILLLVLSSFIMLFAQVAELAITLVGLVIMVYMINPKKSYGIYRLTLLFAMMMGAIAVFLAIDFASGSINRELLVSFLLYSLKLIVLLLLYAPVMSLISAFRLMRALQQIALRSSRIRVDYLFLLVVLFRFIAMLQLLWYRLVVIYRTKYVEHKLKVAIPFFVHYVRELLLTAEATIISFELRQPVSGSRFIYQVKYGKRDGLLLAIVSLVCLGLVIY